MSAIELRGAGIALTGLRESDVPRIPEYCSDPVFEQFMSTPWPYTTADAAWCVREYAPAGWRDGSELTWAVRQEGAGPLLGTVSLRPARGDIGFSLGAPHRGQGIMSAAVGVVIDAALRPEGDSGPLGPRVDGLQLLRWEAVVGNVASLRVAQRAGFRYTGIAPGVVPTRAGEITECWHAVITRAGATPAGADDASTATQRQLPWPA